MIIDDFSKPKLTIVEGSAANDYFTRRKSEEDRIAGVKAPAKNKKNPANTDYAKRRKQQDVEESAPPGDKAERMVKHIKAGYAKDGKLTPKEKGIAFATAWKAHNAGKVEESDRPFRGTGGRFNRGDDERHDLDPSDWYKKVGTKMYTASIYPRQVAQAQREGWHRTKEEARANASPEGVAEGMNDDQGTSEDEILYHLTSAYRSLQKHSDFYQDFSIITHVYETLRSYLKEGDIEGFHSSYERMLSRYPDAAVELFDAMFESAGLPSDTGTIEQFLDKCSQQGVAEGSELKQAKRKYNQAAKDANADQVGAGKKIDTMKKSLRQKDVAKQGVAEAGDTAKGQKQLAKVHHRAADRVTSKQADKDPEYARKAQQTQDRAWDRLAVKEQGVVEAEKNPHTSALGKALYRDLSKEKKASPQQVQRNKERWAQRQAEGQWIAKYWDKQSGNEPVERSFRSKEQAVEFLSNLPDHYVKALRHSQGVAEGLGKDIKRLATGKDVKSRAGQEIAKSQDASMKGDTKTSKKHFDRYDKLDKLANKGVAEGADDHRALGRHHEEMADQELRKVGSKLPDSWDAVKLRNKLASHPKYAQALKHLDKSEYHFGKAAKQGVAEGLSENAEDLHIGDPVIITGNGIKFEGATGEIVDFGQQHRFVVVNLYNHGKHSFHSSDVSFNEYAGSDDEEARMYDAGEFGDDPRDEMDEARMSAAQRLSNAWDKQRAKSDASLRRTPSSIPKTVDKERMIRDIATSDASPEHKKVAIDAVMKTMSESRVQRQRIMAQMLNSR